MGVKRIRRHPKRELAQMGVKKKISIRGGGGSLRGDMRPKRLALPTGGLSQKMWIRARNKRREVCKAGCRITGGKNAKGEGNSGESVQPGSVKRTVRLLAISSS